MWNSIKLFNNIYENKYWINEYGLVKNRFNRILKDRNNNGYRIIDLSCDGIKKTISIHKLVCNTFNIKKKIEHTEIDHIDNNKTNNNKDNLRFIDKSGNNRNKKSSKTNKLGVRGVVITPSGKYRSVIRINGIRKHLGIFKTIEEASNKYEEQYNLIMEEY
jgi:hypothetical protein|tara:strand:+ start:72 stop:554 length:483 start_codon:yes stop_codon:yes gene_type:complete